MHVFGKNPHMSILVLEVGVCVDAVVITLDT